MKKIILGVLGTSFLATSALAAVQTLDTAARKDLNITIYNENRALVKDVRTATVPAGRSTVSFSNISANLIPESALLTGEGIRTIEQNFNYDLLDRNSLLQKAVGTTVSLEYINPKSGEKETGSAILMAYNNGSPVLKVGDKIETDYPGRIIFNTIPSNLISKPTLSLDILSAQPGTQTLDLSYLTTGLSWNANYVAELNDSETEMNLNGFITLNNRSGVGYENASLQLVAGDVNMVNKYHPAPKLAMARGAYMEMEASDSYMPTTESLSDFYLYSLPMRTTIASNQTKQVALLSQDHVKVQKLYVYDNNLNAGNSEMVGVKPTIFFKFENKKDNNLGIALPKGVVRLYKKQGNDRLLFVGEDSIAHTPNMEIVQLRMGQAFDIFAKSKQTSYRQLAKNLTESAYKITFTNGGKKPVDVIYYQNFYGKWTLLSQTVPSEKENANRVKWHITIPAEGEFVFEYKVQIKND